MKACKLLTAAAILAMAGASAHAATLYDCRARPTTRNPDKTTVAIVVINPSGQAIGMDGWSHDDKNPDQYWTAEVMRNDAGTLDARWNTERLRATDGSYVPSVRITLRINKPDLSFRLGLGGPDIRERNLTGTCVKATVKDF